MQCSSLRCRITTCLLKTHLHKMLTNWKHMKHTTYCQPNQSYRRQNNKSKHKHNKQIANLSLIAALKWTNAHSRKQEQQHCTHRHQSSSKARRARTSRAQLLRIELLLACQITKAIRLEKSLRIWSSCRIVHRAKHRGSLTVIRPIKTNEWRRFIILSRW